VSAPDGEIEPVENAPALVRPYALVGGRTHAGGSAPIPVESVVVTQLDLERGTLVLERAAIVRLCERPQSVAEVAVALQVPVGVARVLVADLEAEGFVRVDLPPGSLRASGPDRTLLERVLAGLEAL
jgi:hypothetical protein